MGIQSGGRPRAAASPGTVTLLRCNVVECIVGVSACQSSAAWPEVTHSVDSSPTVAHVPAIVRRLPNTYATRTPGMHRACTMLSIYLSIYLCARHAVCCGGSAVCALTRPRHSTMGAPSWTLGLRFGSLARKVSVGTTTHSSLARRSTQGPSRSCGSATVECPSGPLILQPRSA